VPLKHKCAGTRLKNYGCVRLFNRRGKAGIWTSGKNFHEKLGKKRRDRRGEVHRKEHIVRRLLPPRNKTRQGGGMYWM